MIKRIPLQLEAAGLPGGDFEAWELVGDIATTVQAPDNSIGLEFRFQARWDAVVQIEQQSAGGMILARCGVKQGETYLRLPFSCGITHLTVRAVDGVFLTGTWALSSEWAEAGTRSDSINVWQNDRLVRNHERGIYEFAALQVSTAHVTVAPKEECLLTMLPDALTLLAVNAGTLYFSGRVKMLASKEQMFLRVSPGNTLSIVCDVQRPRQESPKQWTISLPSI